MARIAAQREGPVRRSDGTAGRGCPQGELAFPGPRSDRQPK